MVNYEQAKIYQIRSYKTEKVYIGSTCQNLSMRMAGHRKDFKRYIKGKISYYISSFEILKFEDAYIELIEKFPCKDKEELHKHEGLYIRKLNCVNKTVPGRKHKESIKAYNQSEKGKAKRKAYLQLENVKAKQKIYQKKFNGKIFYCACGGSWSHSHKARHTRSLKHKFYLFNLHNELNHL